LGRLATLRPRIGSIDQRRAKTPPKTAAPFYVSADWRNFIAALIKKRGRRCEDPRHQGAQQPDQRIFGDHIVELQDGGAPFDEANILLRCGSCHTLKTNEARTARMSR